MDKIQGKIDKVSNESGISKVTGKPFKRFLFEINAKKYSTFDAEIGEKFFAGDFVEMSGEQKGQYWNMKEMLKIAEPKNYVQTTTSDNTNKEILVVLKEILAELKSLDFDRTAFITEPIKSSTTSEAVQ